MKSIVRELVKLAKSLISAEEEIANNFSSWSWEDDANHRIAKVFLDTSSGSLRMTIVESHIKSGLGAGTRTATLEDVDLGTVWKPKLSMAMGLLRKNSHERSRAGSPFSRLWVTPSRDKAILGDIIKWKSQSVSQMGVVPMGVVPVRDAEDDRIRLLKMVRNLDPSKVGELLSVVQRM